MKYQRFEQLPVWQAAIDLAIRTYEMPEAREFRRRYSLRDQIERAAVSVSNNIAEGFDRGTNPELSRFFILPAGQRRKSVRCCACWRRWRHSAIRNPASGI